MDGRPTPSFNPLLIWIVMKLGLIRASNPQEKFKVSQPKAKHVLSWVLEYFGCVLFGWLALNLVAIYGSKAARPVIVEHSNWAMQTGDGVVNFTILFLIFVSQIFIFMIRRISGKKSENSFRRGKYFAIPLIFILIGLVALFLRFRQLEPIEYPLYIPNPEVFSVLWIAVSSIVFLGYLGLWKYILIGIVTGQKD